MRYGAGHRPWPRCGMCSGNAACQAAAVPTLRRSRSRSRRMAPWRPRLNTNDLGCPLLAGSSTSGTCVRFFLCAHGHADGKHVPQARLGLRVWPRRQRRRRHAAWHHRRNPPAGCAPWRRRCVTRPCGSGGPRWPGRRGCKGRAGLRRRSGDVGVGRMGAGVASIDAHAHTMLRRVRRARGARPRRSAAPVPPSSDAPFSHCQVQVRGPRLGRASMCMMPGAGPGVRCRGLRLPRPALR